MPTHRPRVNVVVTDEQHALLSELAKLDPSVRSASSFLRAMLDQATPLLRKTVPMMREDAKERDTARSELRTALRDFISEAQQMDLLDADAPHGAERPQRSEDAPHRAPRRSRRG